MFTKSTLLIAALQASLALAGNAIISNRCNYDVYMQSAGIGIKTSNMVKIAAGTQHSEARCTGSCNTSFKISKTNAISAGEHTQFEYSVVNGNQLWYDISLVDCANGESANSCPGHDGGLAVNGAASGCGSAECAAGSYCPSMAYFVDQPLIKLGVKEPVFTCPVGDVDMDLVFKLCSDNAPTKRSIAGRLLIDAIA